MMQERKWRITKCCPSLGLNWGVNSREGGDEAGCGVQGTVCGGGSLLTASIFSVSWEIEYPVEEAWGV